MFRVLLLALALALAASATSQITVNFTAQSGSVGTFGGPQHTIANGTNLAPGLTLTSAVTSGTNYASSSLRLQPMAVANGGFGITLESRADCANNGLGATSTLAALVTVQSPTPRQVVLDISGAGGRYQGGWGSVAVDIDSDGVFELSSVQGFYRIPVTIGPVPRTITFYAHAYVGIVYGFGTARLDFRIVPGTCNSSLVSYGCGGGSRLWFRESISGGVDIWFPSTSTTSSPNPHQIVVLGSQLLATPFPLPPYGCPLLVDPATYWFVPRDPRLGATIHFDVPSSVLPFVSYLSAIDYHPTTLTITTSDTLRIDCQ